MFIPPHQQPVHLQVLTGVQAVEDDVVPWNIIFLGLSPRCPRVSVKEGFPSSSPHG